MSSNLQLDRNLVSVSGFGYRENFDSRIAVPCEPAPVKGAIQMRMELLEPGTPFQSPPIFKRLRDASGLGGGRTGSTNYP